MTTAAPSTQPTEQLPRSLVTLIAVATGAVVANLYYAQPLLHLVAHDFHSGSALASLIITATQVGYAAGLLLVVPLGDLHPRRILVVRIFGLAAVALVTSAVAPDIWVFGLASILVGTASVAGQVMIPFAADLAPAERRGRVVARIMSGLLLGILLARTVSGLVAQLAGWRAIYWFSAALMIAFAAILWRALPAEGPARTSATGAWSARHSGSWSTSPSCAAGPGTGPAASPVSACCGPPSPSCCRARRTTTRAS